MATMMLNSVLEEANVQAPPAANPEAPLDTVPSYIEVGYWPDGDADGGWSAYAQLLGVSATADTEADLFADMVDQVEEFWQILNGRFPTLSDDLKQLLRLRGLPLRFKKQAQA